MWLFTIYTDSGTPLCFPVSNKEYSTNLFTDLQNWMSNLEKAPRAVSIKDASNYFIIVKLESIEAVEIREISDQDYLLKYGKLPSQV